MKINPNDPYFAKSAFVNDTAIDPPSIGLTIRQQFAMAANPDLDFGLSSAEIILGKKMPPQATIMDSIAFWAEFKAHMKVIEADALIAELNRTEADNV
jgi:hypothetical protein